MGKKDNKIMPRNNEGQPHGYWSINIGELHYVKCTYHNGERVGFYDKFRRFTTGKTIQEKRYYIK